MKNKYFVNRKLKLFCTKGTDYANRTTIQSSLPVIIDNTPPVKTDNPVKITGRHITSDTEIEAW